MHLSPWSFPNPWSISLYSYNTWLESLGLSMDCSPPGRGQPPRVLGKEVSLARLLLCSSTAAGGGVCCPLPWPRKAGGWGSTELDAAARVGRSHLEATWGMWLSQDLLWSPKSRKSRHLSGRWVPGAVGAANRGEQDPTAWMWACTSTDSTHHPGSQPHQVNYFLEMTAFINIEKKKKNHFL